MSACKPEGVIGKSVPRRDAPAKLDGSARFTDDLPFDLPLLHGRVLRSPHAHALIRSIDCSAARQLPGVHAVITGPDFPHKIGIYLKDREVFAMQRVHFIGEPVAAVVADNEALAEQALAMIRVDYQPLPAVFDARQSLAPDAPLLHPDLGAYASSDFIYPQAGSNISNHFKIRHGDPDQVWPECVAIVEQTFEIPHIQHTPMEPHIGYALADEDGCVTLWASVQSPFAQQSMLADWLGVDKQKIRVIAPYIGGGFGSKAGVTMEAIPVAMALKVPGRLVRFRHTREEEFYGTFVRQALSIHLKIGCNVHGKLLAMENTMYWNGGAFCEYGVNIARAAGYSCTGPYAIPFVRADSYCIYTNHPAGGAYRGFGMSELHSGIEQCMDMLAEKMGMDKLAFRLNNLVKAGEPLVTGMRMHAHGLEACLKAVTEKIGWQSKKQADAPYKKRGIGLAAVWKAPAMPTTASSEAGVRIDAQGVYLNIGGQEIGQGTHTVALQLAAQQLGIPLNEITVDTENDTQTHAYEWQTVASRITWSMGNAIQKAATDARIRLLALAAVYWQEPVTQLGLQDGKLISFVSEREISYRTLLEENGQGVREIQAKGRFMPEYLTPLDAETGQGEHPVVHFTVGAQAFEIEIDMRSGRIEIIKAVSAFDVGKAINPQLVKAQMEGGMLQGISSALFEELKLENGRVMNPDFRDYRIATFADIPCDMETVIVETPQDDGPCGARGIGEHPMIPSIAALGNAIADACGVRVMNPPFTAEKIYFACHPELNEQGDF